MSSGSSMLTCVRFLDRFEDLVLGFLVGRERTTSGRSSECSSIVSPVVVSY